MCAGIGGQARVSVSTRDLVITLLDASLRCNSWSWKKQTLQQKIARPNSTTTCKVSPDPVVYAQAGDAAQTGPALTPVATTMWKL